MKNFDFLKCVTFPPEKKAAMSDVVVTNVDDSQNRNKVVGVAAAPPNSSNNSNNNNNNGSNVTQKPRAKKKRKTKPVVTVEAPATASPSPLLPEAEGTPPITESAPTSSNLEKTWDMWFQKMVREGTNTLEAGAKPKPKQEQAQVKQRQQSAKKKIVRKRIRAKKEPSSEDEDDNNNEEDNEEVVADQQTNESDEDFEIQQELDDDDDDDDDDDELEALQQILGRGAALLLLGGKKLGGNDAWKQNLTEEEVQKYSWIFEKLDDMELDIPKILRSNLSDFEKEQAINVFLNNRPGHPRYDDTARLIIQRREHPLPAANLARYDALEKHLSRSREHFSLKHKVLDLNLPEKHLTVVWETYEMLQRLEPGQSDYNKHYEWLQWILRMPWGVYCPQPVFRESADLRNMLLALRFQLDRNVYGLNSVKEELMLFCMDRLVQRTFPDQQNQGRQRGGKILAIEGSPGVGKTHLIRTLASSWGLPFQSIAAGGCKDSSFWDGHSITYEGSVPGRVVKAIRQAKTMNPLIYIDELDKLSDHEHSKDVSGILLHILDETQNSEFYDKYFGEVPLDLSQVLWVLSINNRDLIDPVLRDRLHILKIPDPTVKEKVATADEIIIPELMSLYGLTEEDMTFPRETIGSLIEQKTNGEKGMRRLKQVLEAIIRRIAFLKDTLVSLPAAAVWHAAQVTTLTSQATSQSSSMNHVPFQLTHLQPAQPIPAEIIKQRKLEKEKFLQQTSFAIKDFRLPVTVTRDVAESLLRHFSPDEVPESVRRMFH